MWIVPGSGNGNHSYFVQKTQNKTKNHKTEHKERIEKSIKIIQITLSEKI